MKRIVISLVLFCMLLVGCSRYNKNNVIQDLNKKIMKGNGYYLKGNLSVSNNDEVYHYDVEVCHKEKDFYKVTLTNTANEHTQIILKNNDGVYVLTPSLNKSFRFQSEWPYDNSQIYLLDALINDIKRDSNLSFSQENNSFVFKTKVNYPNNRKLSEQKIIIDNNMKPKKIIVYDKSGGEAMDMTFEKIDYSPKFSNDEFDVDFIISSDDDSKEVEETSSLEDVIYPLFLPNGTKLVGEEKIKKNNGERVIMNFDGDKSFLLVEETADVFNEFTVIPTSGEPYLLMDTLGVATDNSLQWTSGGIDYYIVSDVMSVDEMVEVAQSISGIVSMK